jgi:hypothetical protein
VTSAILHSQRFWHISCIRFSSTAGRPGRRLAEGRRAAVAPRSGKNKEQIMDFNTNGDRQPVVCQTATAWPVCWSAVWVGALTALAVALVAGLAGIAVGAHLVGPGQQVANWRQVQFGGVAWAVCSAFLSFVAGGWVAARINGQFRSEPAMLHGAIAWLAAVPLLVLLASLGAGSYFGAWYTGLAGHPAWAAPATVQDAAEALAIARNSALGAVTALLLGLVGSVLGGWMGSGEPMTLTYYRTRDRAATRQALHVPE